MVNSKTIFSAVLGLSLSAVSAVNADDKFPADQFAPEVFGGLSGEVIFMDQSGGAMSEARGATIFANFEELSGVKVTSDFSSMAKFTAAMEAGADIPWSVIEFATIGDLERAVSLGYVDPLDLGTVPVGNMVDGNYNDHGVHTLAYGIVLTYNTEKFPDAASAPKSLTDLFDVANYPGKRCFFNYPQYGATLESALLADGVGRDDLYPLDVERSLAKLDTIRDQIVWWDNGDEAIRFLTSGECDLGVTWSGRAYSAVKNDNAPLAVVWNDSMYSVAAIGVPKGAPNPKAGQALIAMTILDLQGQRELVNRITYTTAIKQLELEGYGSDLDPWIVAGENAEVAIREDTSYYAKHLPEVVEKFNRWMALQ